uniref:Triacylglycerol lipase n=1 Tax=Panagrolaimus sp. PS1159 TaxID=55785 RepID=A0AC35F6D4_9BILA
MGPGLLGSFGGKSCATDVLRNRPVIFVHGIMFRAGNWMLNYYHFLLNGYTSAELYATTWGDGGATLLCQKTFTCEDVKQVRQFIIAVNEYTGTQVDVIGFSGGVAISRKAILGGCCVDTGEALGDPLTESINTYVAVAGVAYGMESCLDQEAGNLINGVNCNSAYMRDVNFPPHRYEGTYSYFIYSESDEIIRKNCCGHLCPELKNALAFKCEKYMLHPSIIVLTEDVQLKMVQHRFGI